MFKKISLNCKIQLTKISRTLKNKLIKDLIINVIIPEVPTKLILEKELARNIQQTSRFNQNKFSRNLLI